jgi:hypothetical protein
MSGSEPTRAAAAARGGGASASAPPHRARPWQTNTQTLPPCTSATSPGPATGRPKLAQAPRTAAAGAAASAVHRGRRPCATWSVRMDAAGDAAAPSRGARTRPPPRSSRSRHSALTWPPSSRPTSTIPSTDQRCSRFGPTTGAVGAATLAGSSGTPSSPTAPVNPEPAARDAVTNATAKPAQRQHLARHYGTGSRRSPPSSTATSRTQTADRTP